MKTIILSTPIFRKEESDYFLLVQDFLRVEGVDLKISLQYELDNHLPFVIQAAELYGNALISLKFSSIITEAEKKSIKQLAMQWGEEEYYHDEKIQKLINGYEFQLRTISPALVILWNRFSVANKIIELIATKIGIKTITLERTPFPHLLSLDFYGSLCDAKVYEDTLQKIKIIDELPDANYTASEEYESILKKLKLTWWPQPKNQELTYLKKTLGINDDSIVILFLGQVDNDIQNFRHNPFFKKNTDAFASFIDTLPCEKNYFILGKHHPMATEDPIKYGSLLGSKRGIWTENLSMPDALSLANFVVAVNSAGAFEAVLKGLPTMTLGRTMYSDMSVFFEWRKVADHETTRQWLSADDRSTSKRTRRAKYILNEYLKEDIFFFGTECGPHIKGSRDLARRLTTHTESERDTPGRLSKIKLIGYLLILFATPTNTKIQTMKKHLKILMRTLRNSLRLKRN